jgi:hypothetical protein
MALFVAHRRILHAGDDPDSSFFALVRPGDVEKVHPATRRSEDPPVAIPAA